MPNIAYSGSYGLRILRSAVVALSLAVALPSTSAENDPPNFVKPLPPTQRVFVDNTNLSANDFFAAYMSKSVEVRRYAELYLLGVLDATEGVTWCDYRRFLSITLGEEIYLSLKDLDRSKRNARAARVITEILTNKFPCRKGKS